MKEPDAMTPSENLIDAALQWEQYAENARAMDKLNREQGIYAPAMINSPLLYQAKSAERCAQTLRLQHETGDPHCMCHMRPRRECPNASNGPTFLNL